MNTDDARLAPPGLAALCVASLAALVGCGGNACIGLDGCSGANVAPSVALSGHRRHGQGARQRDGQLHLRAGIGVRPVRRRWTLQHCVQRHASVHPRRDLRRDDPAFARICRWYLQHDARDRVDARHLASQLGTTESGLIAGFPGNSRFQQALANQTDVLAAQSAVVANLQSRYSVTLTAPAFLTTPFIVGQAGVDSDLGVLSTAGAIDANGMPDPAAVSLMSAAGAAHPLTTTSAPSSGTGGTSGTTGGMM